MQAEGKAKGNSKKSMIPVMLLVAVLVYLYNTPYATLKDFQTGLRDGDADKVDKIVDYGQVREGLKRDFRALAMGEVEDDPSIKNKLLGVLGLALGEKVADPVVDYVVSPAGLRDVIAGQVPVLSRHGITDGDADNDAANAAAPAAKPKKAEYDCKYTDLNDFLVVIHSPSGSETKLTFQRQGLLTWHLTHIRLMPARM